MHLDVSFIFQIEKTKMEQCQGSFCLPGDWWVGVRIYIVL